MTGELHDWTATQQRAATKAADAWGDFFDKHTVDEADSVEAAALVTRAQTEHEDELLDLTGVVAVAPSLKVSKGQPTQTWALSVYVVDKQPKTKLSKAQLIPALIDGVPTDVVEVGEIRPLAFTAKTRPALPGFSIGHPTITAGTFGALVRNLRRCCPKDPCEHADDPRHEYLVLSNNHVLAASNQGTPGDLVIQPGSFDGGLSPSDAIATLERFEPLTLGPSRAIPGRYNLVDAAVARPLDTRNVTASVVGVVIPRGVGQALVGQQVIKAGRTTEVTTGQVIATNATVVVGPYNSDGTGFGQFRHQIITTGMSAGGDSGSLLMTRSSLEAVGLLFAGSSTITIHNHISDVETALGVRPVTAPRFS